MSLPGPDEKIKVMPSIQKNTERGVTSKSQLLNRRSLELIMRVDLKQLLQRCPYGTSKKCRRRHSFRYKGPKL